MLRLFLNGNLFYSFNQNENPDHYLITSLKLSKEINALSTLSLTTLITHPKASGLKIKKDMFILADNSNCIFIGKVKSKSINRINGEVELEIEDLIGCMRDKMINDDQYTYVEEGDQRKPVHLYTYRRLITKAISTGMVGYGGYQYSFPTAAYTINVGNAVTGTSRIDSEIVQDITGTDCLSIIYNTVNTWAYGILYSRVRGVCSTSGTPRYTVNEYRLIYSDELNSNNSYRDNDGYLYYGEDELGNMEREVDFEYGYNILNIDFENSQIDPITSIFAYGTYTLSNTEIDYPVSATIMGPYSITSKYGSTQKAINFGHLGTYNGDNSALTELRNIANEFVNERLMPFCDKATINGIDPFYINNSKSKPIDICDLVRIRIQKGTDIMDYSEYCLALEIDYFNHENDRYVIGPFIPDNILEYSVANSYVTHGFASIGRVIWEHTKQIKRANQ